MQLGEDERREVPDFFFGARFAKAATGEAAADGEGQRDEFAGGQRRRGHHQTDQRARIRAGDQAGEKRAFQREVGRIVSKQEAEGDPGRERNAEAAGEQQSIRPRAALGNQNVAEAMVANQNRGQRRHECDLDDQRRQQELFGREKLRLLHTCIVQ